MDVALTYRYPDKFANRLMGLIVVAGVHIAALYALMWHPQAGVTQSTAAHSAILIVEAVRPTQERLMATMVSLRAPQPEVTRPELEVVVPHQETKPTPPMVTIGPREILGATNHFPDSEYPPLSRQQGEEGIVTLSLQVLEDGSIGDVVVDQSSGFEALDQAAISYAKQHWHFAPGLRDGEPFVAWKTASIVFQLKKIAVHF
jgi:TonB family protein